ncbi:MAG TPA: GMC oxidoreductase [Trebonia sp.]|nr:GMC oxidoreductase [Trebonia sp.]
MFDFHVGPDITVVSGCGLGGTSLINANVALEPGDPVFADARWPEPLRDHPEVLRPFLGRAREMLGSSPYPPDWPSLPKLRVLEEAAEGLGREVIRPDINVTFADGANAAGVRQSACTLCGDCCSGCNYGAKNTVLMNYLPDAHAHGAHIFTEVAVRSVARSGGTWRVDFTLADDPGAPSRSVTADVVVLAAGTLGTAQILLRSREFGLPVSGRLGEGFSANGDVLAFAYDTDDAVRGLGLGKHVPREQTLVGPAITGMIDLRGNGSAPNPLIIEDGAIPGALAAVVPLVLSAASNGIPEPAARRLRELAGIPFGSYRGPVGRTLTYLVMSTDDAGGRLVLENDQVHVVWPEAGQQPAFTRDNDVLATATRALHGTETPDPLWAWTNGRSLITVHPLGGCAMADDADGGVVDHKGRVFDPDGGGVHDGLYVCDGSVIPCSLDVNPLLTISAIAERTAAIMIEDRKWAPAAGPESPSPAPVLAPPRVRLEFAERMAGFVAIGGSDGYADGFDRGRRDGARVELDVTISYDDIHAVLDDPRRPARISGEVRAAALSAHPLTVTEGRFTLFDPDPSRVETWRMRYRMTLRSADGRTYLFDGHKELRESGGARHAWSETTTLYTTIRAERPGGAPGDGAAEGGTAEGGTGILHLKPADLARLIGGITVEGVPGHKQREYRRAFLELFADELVHVYGGVLDEPADFPSAPRAAPRVREPGQPDGTWWCGGGRRWHAGDKPGDDAFLRLTRYHAGDKGPVMLASGFGMSSHSFLTPTISQNLTEFLAERGYDVWLFDCRAGIDLPSSGTQFTIDDIARVDWPVAVRKVLDETGRDDLQVFGHCVGSGSLQMAILAGLEGVRAAVCAQFPMHLVTSPFDLAKSRLHTAGIFRRLGAGGLAPDTRGSVPDELLDAALRTLPMPAEERCGEAVCRWINAIYGLTHRHAQLNEPTHRALNGMFGFGNVESLEHLSLMMRRGLAVTHTGGEEYFAHPERFARTSLLLLQGTQNYIFRPAGTLRTLRWLQRGNPRGDYHRELLHGYAHLDAIVGSRAATDVYPRIADFLDARQG